MTRRSSKVRTWRAASGAWLGIGTAPGALVLGAQVGGRHDGALPLIVLVVGGAVMAALLAAQGRLGLRAPAGEDAGMTDLAPRYLPPMAERAFTALLAAAMVGWFGFNVGLGGAAAAALVGVPDAAGVVALTVPMVAILIAGGGRWNAVAVATTLTAIALIGIVAVRLAPPGVAGDVLPGGPARRPGRRPRRLHRLRVGVRRPGPRLHRRPARARRPRGLRGAPRRPRARGLHRGRRGRGGQRIHRRRRRPGRPGRPPGREPVRRRLGHSPHPGRRPLRRLRRPPLPPRPQPCWRWGPGVVGAG
ncbi:hypothetical protein [Actinomadura madurae]|uniref:hypothetical protein n=1 Tax=Actinomadura madurae TaxID=1993 RepID=UPI0020D2226E|nr:hypothetical protein [Actinomadura madurae]MCQ0005420.1 hypothetical protein [Actinomadura madurae]